MSRSSRIHVIAALLGPAAGVGLADGALAQDTRASRRGAEAHRTPVPARDTGLRWLAGHQERDGRWSAAGFQARCPNDDRCGGPGDESQDVLVTSLCLLAFLGGGSTTARGPHQEVVARGVEWLRASQDADGLFGSRSHQSLLHAGHGVATLALSEAFLLSGDPKDPRLQSAAQKGIDHVLRFRTEGGAWNLKTRAGEVSSATIWMLLAVASAEEAGLEVSDEETVKEEILAWLDERTDPVTGLVSRVRPTSTSRHPGNAQPPPNTDVALCAAGLVCRHVLGQEPRHTAVMNAAAETLAASLRNAGSVGPLDPCLLYLGSFAMFQMGGSHWSAWMRATYPRMGATQRAGGHLAGSWDPAGASAAQGRIAATAMNVLAIEFTCRMARVTSGR
jgi:hypothetical protein